MKKKTLGRLEFQNSISKWGVTIAGAFIAIVASNVNGLRGTGQLNQVLYLTFASTLLLISVVCGVLNILVLQQAHLTDKRSAQTEILRDQRLLFIQLGSLVIATMLLTFLVLDSIS